MSANGREGRMNRRIVPGGILALSFAVVLLAATASSASASVALGTWSCPPPSTPAGTIAWKCWGPRAAPPWVFHFGYHLVGTSTSRRVALGAWWAPLEPRVNETFNPTIGVSGDYAQTNNCPPTLSAVPWSGPHSIINGCVITVTFTPTGERKGPRRGTLSTGPGGPELALTGNGEPRDSVPPDLKLSGDKAQNPQNDTFTDGPWANVMVRVSCGDHWCRARATGRLTNVKQDKLSPDFPLDIVPGKTVRMGPELTRYSQRREVRKALAEGKNVKAIVTVRAKDLSGNVATAKRTIKLVKNTGASPRPPKAAGAPYNTRVTIIQSQGAIGVLYGYLYSGDGRCEVHRKVKVFKQQPGTDRKLAVRRSGHNAPNHWDLLFQAGGKQGWHVYALVRREVRRHGLVCRSARSRIWTVR
jgi:hypothetical protein